jgi:outer membrane protein assembly factor BamB
MELQERLTRIISQPGRGILATDLRGGLHRLDADLNLVASTQASVTGQDPAGHPVYAIMLAGDYVITRDKVGNICRWDAETLRLVDRLDARATADQSILLDDEQPSPTMVRGIGVWQGKAYVDNGYFQVVVIDLATFTVDKIVMWPSGYDMLEWFCTDAPDVHAVADRAGRIHLGSLETLEFPTVVKLDVSNVHRVMYDARHKRYWATLDAGLGDTRYIANGVTILGLDGIVGEQMLYARNDVEALVFSPDFTRTYVGGFDGELLVFDNSTPQLQVSRRVGGFSHQIIDMAVDDAGRVHTLTQDGELTVFTPDGDFVRRMDFGRQCVWDLQPIPGDESALLAATDDGTAVVRLVEPSVGQPALVCAEHDLSGLGFTRRAVAHDGGWTGIFWPRTVRRVDSSGDTLWETELAAKVHTVAVSPDGSRVLVACNDGGIELDAANGHQVDKIDDVPTSVWACAYLADGQRLLATRNGMMTAWNASGEVTWSVDLGSYPKRLIVDGDRLRVTGGGGVKEFLVGEDKPDRTFTEVLDNTVENGVVIDGTVVAISYGMQISAYDYESGELLALQEDLPDFPKGLATLRGRNGDAYVVAGGRGGWLRLYRIDRDGTGSVLTALRDMWLPREAAGYPSAAAGS